MRIIIANSPRGGVRGVGGWEPRLREVEGPSQAHVIVICKKDRTRQRFWNGALSSFQSQIPFAANL